MLEIITPRNAHRKQALLTAMQRMRYDVTRGVMGWNVPYAPSVPQGLDRDEFDRDDTLYLVVTGEGGAVLGCARLNQTTGPHMLSEVFADCCNLQGVRRDPRVFEFSRYIIDPGACGSKLAFFRTMATLELAINVACLDAGATAVTWLAEQRMYARSCKAWRTEPLGLPTYFEDDDQTYVAALSVMDEQGLAKAASLYRFGDDDLATLRRTVGPVSDAMAEAIRGTEAPDRQAA